MYKYNHDNDLYPDVHIYVSHLNHPVHYICFLYLKIGFSLVLFFQIYYPAIWKSWTRLYALSSDFV